MSQIATCTVLEVSVVPLLGFWSKPKHRFLRKPVSMFEEFLEKNRKTTTFFTHFDGVYVAIAATWLEMRCIDTNMEIDPVVETVRNNTGGSYWLFTHSQKSFSEQLKANICTADKDNFVSYVGVDDSFEFNWEAFKQASEFLASNISSLNSDEAMLLCIG